MKCFIVLRIKNIEFYIVEKGKCYVKKVIFGVFWSFYSIL